MVNNSELINKMINNINKLDDEIIKEAIQEVENEDMEEDIKILEGECDCIYFENGKCQYNNGKSKCDKGQAIENLLKRYKELEEEVESQDKTIDKLVEEQEEREKYTHSLEEENKRLNENNINMQKELFVNSIPISVIQNTLEKLEEVIKITKENLKYEENTDVRIRYETTIDQATAGILVLQELLEERNK